MALLRIESFDHFDTSHISEKVTTTGGTPAVVTGGRCDTKACEVVGNDAVTYGLAVGSVVGVVGFAAKFSGLSSVPTGLTDGHIIIGDEGYGTLNAALYLLVTPTGAIRIVKGALTGTVLGTSAGGVIGEGVYHYIEFKFDLQTTAVGSISVRVDGVEVLSVSNVVTGGTFLGNATFLWDGVDFAAEGATVLYDDIYILDGTGSTNIDFLGDSHVTAVLPQTDAVSAGTHSDWTPSTGSDHGALVDENPSDDDTTYVSSASANEQDSFNYPNLSLVDPTIHGVQTNIVARKDDGGTRTIRSLVRSGGSDDEGANMGVADDFAVLMTVYNQEPVASADWDLNAVNAAEFGVKLQA